MKIILPALDGVHIVDTDAGNPLYRRRIPARSTGNRRIKAACKVSLFCSPLFYLLTLI